MPYALTPSPSAFPILSLPSSPLIPYILSSTSTLDTAILRDARTWGWPIHHIPSPSPTTAQTCRERDSSPTNTDPTHDHGCSSSSSLHCDPLPCATCLLPSSLLLSQASPARKDELFRLWQREHGRRIKERDERMKREWAGKQGSKSRKSLKDVVKKVMVMARGWRMTGKGARAAVYMSAGVVGGAEGEYREIPSSPSSSASTGAKEVLGDQQGLWTQEHNDEETENQHTHD